MWYDALFIEMENNTNAEQAVKMSAYMKNQFKFLGIPKPKLKIIMKPYLMATKKECIDWEFINICWGKEYREAQYVGIEYLMIHKKQLVPENIEHLKELITIKSWWEVTDQLDELVGILALADPVIKTNMLDWSLNDNIWIRRVAIDFQQKYKERTDSELLKKIIVNNFNSKEFFINKAIGWSLREYSKVNPEWVKEFIDENKESLASLSIKEGSRLLKNNL